MKQNYTQKPEKYLGEVRYKDFYSEYYSRINALNIKTVTELGMGSGDFLYHLPEGVQGTGIDMSSELVEVANISRKKKNLTFRCLDILQDSSIEKSDLVVMTGFMCTFLDFKVAIDKALDIAEKYIFINDFLNEHGVDCKYTFREEIDEEFQTVYNIWSRRTIESYLNELGLSYSIEPYELSSELRQGARPLFNYHAILDGNRVLTNKGGILLNGYNIFISIKR
jgi:hypothetical protein